MVVTNPVDEIMFPVLYRNTNILLMLDEYISKLSAIYADLHETDSKKVIVNEILRSLKMT